jgi:hypothetical protein
MPDGSEEFGVPNGYGVVVAAPATALCPPASTVAATATPAHGTMNDATTASAASGDVTFVVRRVVESPKRWIDNFTVGTSVSRCACP